MRSNSFGIPFFRIGRQRIHEKSQHVGRENLAILGQRIYTRREMLLLDGQKCIGFQSKINRRVLAQAISGGLQLAANSCSMASDNYNSFSGVSYFSRLFWVKSARFF
jgi:hypothetical protein